jgi:AcrR family transcriptional regulator
LSARSHKSSARTVRPARLPQRANGRARVAAILEAAAAVFEEKGYEGATVAEIAARSKTRIGSLYRFFPNKQSLADTIIVSTRETLDAEFDRFDIHVAALPVRALADGLIALVLGLFNRPAVKKLLDTDRDWSIKREQFRLAFQRRIANALMIHTPGLSKKLAEDAALLVGLNVKAMASHMAFFGSASDVPDEFRDMIRLYLQSRLRRSRSKIKSEPRSRAQAVEERGKGTA